MGPGLFDHICFFCLSVWLIGVDHPKCGEKASEAQLSQVFQVRWQGQCPHAGSASVVGTAGYLKGVLLKTKE